MTERKRHLSAVSQAEPVRRTPKGTKGRPVLMPAPDDPMTVARKLLADPDLLLRHWRNTWMRWAGPHWSEDQDTAMRSWLYTELEHAEYEKADSKGNITTEAWLPNRNKIANLLQALQAVTHLADGTSPPAWLAPGPCPPGEVVACANGLMHVGTRKVLGHTPEFFNLVSVPFAYDPAAPEPARWLNFLDQLWPGDTAAVEALQEFFGYVLSGRTDLQKILLLIGPTRSGKGTIARVLTGLLGSGHIAGPTLASLGTNFGLSPLLGKPLAVISDARLSGTDTRQVVERLLSISGEDTLTVDRKYKDPWTGQIPARFLIISNELPNFGDASGAIAARFIVLIMERSWLGKENTRLTAELKQELPGILNWSLDGLERLSRRGYLTEPSSSAEAVAALQDLVSPVSAFVRDQCQRSGEVPVAELFGAWRQWCEDNGHRPGSVHTFGRNLRAVLPSLGGSRPREGQDRRRFYTGISPSSAPHNGAVRGPSRTTGDPVRDGPRTGPLLLPLACTVCGQAMDPDLTEATGSTTHPNCDSGGLNA